MRQSIIAVVLTASLGFPCAPAAGQLFGFPDRALPSAYGASSPMFAGTYARGLNAASGERGATGAAAGMVANPVTILGGVGLLEGEGTDQITLGAGISADIAPLGGSGRLAVQTGVGWLQSGEFGDDLTFLRFPVGIAMKGRIEGATSALTPWVMPRLDIMRLTEQGTSTTETDLGASGGVTLTMTSGLGLHTAVDVVFRELDDVWIIGIGAHYAPRR